MAELHAIVGDIHGCFDALRRLEDRVARHAARAGLSPLIVSVGDMVDRGPDSAAVVRHIRLGAAAGTHHAVLGNHEEMMLASVHALTPELLDGPLHRAVVPFREAWLRQESQSSRWFPPEVFEQFRVLMWLGQGGVPTLKSWGTAAPTDPSTWQIDPDDLRFLNALPMAFVADGVVVTHALIDAGGIASLSAEDDEVRHRASKLALWGRALPAERPDPVRTHVSGHSILRRGVKRNRALGVVQVDTGAFAGGRLSCWCVETDRVISVPA